MNTFENYRIDDERLYDVNAGTIGANRYADVVYQHAGFQLEHHFIAKDEFILNGKVYHHDEANAIIEKLGYQVDRVPTFDYTICIVKVNGQEVMRYNEHSYGSEYAL